MKEQLDLNPRAEAMPEEEPGRRAVLLGCLRKTAVSRAIKVAKPVENGIVNRMKKAFPDLIEL